MNYSVMIVRVRSYPTKGSEMAFLWAEDTDCTEDIPLRLYYTFCQYSLLMGVLMKVCMDDTISERYSFNTLRGTEEELSVHRRKSEVVALG